MFWDMNYQFFRIFVFKGHHLLNILDDTVNLEKISDIALSDFYKNSRI